MLNRVILMGRLVADPELRQTPSGVSVATFRVAVDRNYQAKGSAERQADFISCVAWRQTGEFISRYFQKGRMIALEGSLQTRNYEDKQGNKRTAYEVIVEQAYFADSRPAGQETGRSNYVPFPTEPPQFDEPQRGKSLSVGDFGGFEAVEPDDGDLPF
ncbi:MAG: single-stranded DNA-binding protein [Oscillospiraceae bacterium]|nr:single-stranded DNA-binding protein [Oscillospiraceae bacterium]